MHSAVNQKIVDKNDQSWKSFYNKFINASIASITTARLMHHIPSEKFTKTTWKNWKIDNILWKIKKSEEKYMSS